MCHSVNRVYCVALSWLVEVVCVVGFYIVPCVDITSLPPVWIFLTVSFVWVFRCFQVFSGQSMARGSVSVVLGRDEGVIHVAGHPLLNRKCTRLPRHVCLRNDLFCIGWCIKLYCSLTRSLILCVCCVAVHVVQWRHCHNTPPCWR